MARHGTALAMLLTVSAVAANASTSRELADSRRTCSVAVADHVHILSRLHTDRLPKTSSGEKADAPQPPYIFLLKYDNTRVRFRVAEQWRIQKF